FATRFVAGSDLRKISSQKTQKRVYLSPLHHHHGKWCSGASPPCAGWRHCWLHSFISAMGSSESRYLICISSNSVLGTAVTSGLISSLFSAVLFWPTAMATPAT